MANCTKCLKPSFWSIVLSDCRKTVPINCSWIQIWWASVAAYKSTLLVSSRSTLHLISLSSRSTFHLAVWSPLLLPILSIFIHIFIIILFLLVSINNSRTISLWSIIVLPRRGNLSIILTLVASKWEIAIKSWLSLFWLRWSISWFGWTHLIF